MGVLGEIHIRGEVFWVRGTYPDELKDVKWLRIEEELGPHVNTPAHGTAANSPPTDHPRSSDPFPIQRLPSNFHKAPPPTHRGYPLPLPPVVDEDAEPRDGADPSLPLVPLPLSLDVVPLPTNQRTLTPDDLATFVRTHPDFRTSPVQAVNLASPYILATTVLNPIHHH
jgi:hypothetical protein